MHEKSDIFLPLTITAYKENKVQLLRTQMKTVQTIERIKRIKEIRKIKQEQRDLLRKVHKEIREHYAAIKEHLPKIEDTTKIVENNNRLHKRTIHNTPHELIAEQVKRRISTHSKLDRELEKIQEKIRHLDLEHA